MLIMGVICWSTEVAHAQFRGNESYQKLMEDSDLVIIGTPVKPSKQLSEITEIPNFYKVRNNGSRVQGQLRGLETTFAIDSIIKGDDKIKSVILHHYMVTETCGGNCTKLVSFDPIHNVQDQGSFILFLVKEKEGRFAPTHGQIDPGEKAISRLSSPG